MSAAEQDTTEEMIPSMAEFEDEINKSFHEIKEGDMIEGTVIGVSETEVTVDLGYYTEGIVPLEECSNDPAFSIKNDIVCGEKIKAVIIRRENREGNIVLSLKQANDILVWDELEEALEEHRQFEVKISQAVNGGVVAYLKGIRGFIPASQLTVGYVEDLEMWIGKNVPVVIITAEKPKLVLSAKEVEKEQALLEKTKKISKLTPGLVTSGTVERIESYGIFVSIGESLQGLVHISQMSNKFLKSPKELVKLGDTVKVKILDIKGDKISLSMKALALEEEAAENIREEEEETTEYQSGEEATTSLGDLLKQFKI